jgi:hypothetical protein
LLVSPGSEWVWGRTDFIESLERLENSRLNRLLDTLVGAGFLLSRQN